MTIGFEINHGVRVKEGFVDDDFGIDMAGWTGIITNIKEEEPDILIELNISLFFQYMDWEIRKEN